MVRTVVEPGRLAHREEREAALDALAAAAPAVVDAATLDEALAVLADAARRAVGADVALVRVAEPDGFLSARAVAGPRALAAELEGSRLDAEELPAEPLVDLAEAPAPVLRAAGRVGAEGLLLVPVRAGGRPLASLELLRRRPFDLRDQRPARVAAAQIALVLRAFGAAAEGAAPALAAHSLEVVGEALAAATDDTRAPAEVTRLAQEVTGAVAALLWERGPGDELSLTAAYGLPAPAPDLAFARVVAARALAEPGPLEAMLERGLPAGMQVSAGLPLGLPAIGVLQLLFAEAAPPGDAEQSALPTFAARAAGALRAGTRARALAQDLARTQSLLTVVGRATAELSLSHTLETAVEGIAELLGAERLAVYLVEEGRLFPAAGRGLAGPHVRVAERLLELTLGPLRSRGVVVIERVSREPLLAAVAGAASEAGIAAAAAVPLVAHEETIGLLAIYPSPRRLPSSSDRALLAALAGQLAVAVQNARLHEQATELGEELEQALSAERQAARRLRALYEISRSFAQSLSLEATLEAVAQTVVDVLDLDAAVVRMPDPRREQLLPLASHIADPTLAGPAAAILLRPQPFASQPIQRLFRDGRPLRLDPQLADRIGVPLLAPFLGKGWTAAVVPISTPGEVIATLTLCSFRPGAPITEATIDAAVAIGGQAALAIDNARLYQQQKEFADTMQRSLLPRSEPELPGLEVGQVYESSARVDVGGDVYDFLELPENRLAVVLGDVTGHGIDATADMAMAKFVFRSLAREHPRPGAFLAAANDVVVGEIASGKFITMAYVVVDPEQNEVACAAAGHPPPRLVLPDGTVRGLEARGLVLGVEDGQTYEEIRSDLPIGSAVVVYTDGVIEARRDGELYGTERLDALLSARRGLSARELALAVVADCRAFAGGELLDDVAVVVIKRV